MRYLRLGPPSASGQGRGQGGKLEPPYEILTRGEIRQCFGGGCATPQSFFSAQKSSNPYAPSGFFFLSIKFLTAALGCVCLKRTLYISVEIGIDT